MLNCGSSHHRRRFHRGDEGGKLGRLFLHLSSSVLVFSRLACWATRGEVFSRKWTKGIQPAGVLLRMLAGFNMLLTAAPRVSFRIFCLLQQDWLQGYVFLRDASTCRSNAWHRAGFAFYFFLKNRGNLHIRFNAELLQMCVELFRKLPVTPQVWRLFNKGRQKLPTGNRLAHLLQLGVFLSSRNRKFSTKS